MNALAEVQKVSWPSVIQAGVAGTVVVTLTMWLSGTDIIGSLGAMVLGMDASQSFRYLVGAAIHLSVGLAYSVIFAVLFAPVKVWSRLTKGVIFGFVITVVALTLMPVAAGMFGGAGTAGANPCAAAAANPCATRAMHPCNPCGRNPCAGNPCGGNPCAGNPCGGAMRNPCGANPCKGAGRHQRLEMKPAAGNPCAPRAAANPCAGGGNPCGGGGGNPYAGLISLVNHIALALVIAFLVKTRRDGEARR